MNYVVVSIITLTVILSGAIVSANHSEKTKVDNTVESISGCDCEPGCEPEIEVMHDVYTWSGITAVITNMGDADCTDVNWSIDITGGIFGFIINKEVNGIISCISPGESVTVRSGMIFGFGRITITVSVENGVLVEEHIEAFIIFFFMKIR